MQSKMYHFSYSSVFAEEIAEYVELKQAMGLWFRTAAENLHRFDRLCVELDIQTPELTDGLISKWVAPRPGESGNTRVARIVALKGFADFLNSKGARIKWPYIQQRWQGQSQFVPYIFTSDEVARILKVADAQPIPAYGSQFHIIFPAILRVLYGTGLRISEALHLKNVDVDL